MRYLIIGLMVLTCFLGFNSSLYANPTFGTTCSQCHSDEVPKPADHIPTNGTTCLTCHAKDGFELPADYAGGPLNGSDGGQVEPPPADDNDGGQVEPPPADDNDGGQVEPPPADDNDDGQVEPPPAGDNDGGQVEPPADDNDGGQVEPPADDNDGGQATDVDTDTDTGTEKNISVDIDVNPCISPNYIKLGAKGIVKVVIKGSRKLDVKTIDTGSILFANARPVKFYVRFVSCNCADRDFKKDLVLIFRRCDLALDSDTTDVTLTGETLTGVFFKGTDSVKIIDCRR